MPPERAVDVARHLSAKFMADVCMSMDPRRSQALLRRVPAEVVVLAAAELLRRGEFIVMAQFVDHLGDAAIRAVLERVLDDAAVVRVGFYAENAQRLDQLIGLLADSRLDGMLKAIAGGDAGLQVAGLVLVSQLSPAQQGRIAGRLLGLEEKILEAMAAAARRESASAVLAELLDRASEPARTHAIRSGALQKLKALFGA
jgi:hypothetical protein